MSQPHQLPITITGWGAVSPAGWTSADLLAAVDHGQPLPGQTNQRDPRARHVKARLVPKPTAPHPFLREARMRRTSPITHFAYASMVEALGPDRLAAVKFGALRVGIICTIMNGCVSFSRRFYSEALADPHTASPLIFPETVFNAPSSHLSAMISSPHPNYTIVGDSAQFVASFQLAAQWIEEGIIDGCLIVGSEEFDWLSGEAAGLLDRHLIVSEGSACVYVEKSADSAMTWWNPQNFFSHADKKAVVQKMAQQFSNDGTTHLIDGLTGAPRSDAAELAAWSHWHGPRLSPKKILGEGLGAGTGWQCVLAAARRQRDGQPSLVSAIGTNQQATMLLIS